MKRRKFELVYVAGAADGLRFTRHLQRSEQMHGHFFFPLRLGSFESIGFSSANLRRYRVTDCYGRCHKLHFKRHQNFENPEVGSSVPILIFSLAKGDRKRKTGKRDGFVAFVCSAGDFRDILSEQHALRCRRVKACTHV